MNIIKSKFFNWQFNKLKKKYPKIINDIDLFENNIDIEPYSDLWNDTYKFRVKNSSVPVWKRWWFRIIIFFIDKANIIPLYIYSKNEKENVSYNDIIKAKQTILDELQK